MYVTYVTDLHMCAEGSWNSVFICTAYLFCGTNHNQNPPNFITKSIGADKNRIECCRILAKDPRARDIKRCWSIYIT